MAAPSTVPCLNDSHSKKPLISALPSHHHPWHPTAGVGSPFTSFNYVKSNLYASVIASSRFVHSHRDLQASKHTHKPYGILNKRVI
eukprot:scaffold148628_cov17-Tisochrysis_lutea.AAC.1